MTDEYASKSEYDIHNDSAESTMGILFSVAFEQHCNLFVYEGICRGK